MINWPPKSPGDVKDYDINWLPALGTDTIMTSVWSTPTPAGLTVNSNSFTAARTKVWLSGGTVGLTYLLTNTITTTLGDTEIETAIIRISSAANIVVEDGTGIPTANSYASEVMLNTYCADRAITIPNGDAPASLIRATRYIESNYRNRWSGMRTKYRGLQGLSWPRFGAFVDDGYRPKYQGMLSGAYVNESSYFMDVGYIIQPNEIPIEVIQATCEAAIRELKTPGVLTPDLSISPFKVQRAGDTELQFFPGYDAAPILTIVEGILGPLLMSRTDLFGTTDRTT